MNQTAESTVIETPENRKVVPLKIPDKVRNILFVAEGGLGKVIASTAVIASIKKAFPDKRIIVISGFTDVFLYNPNIYKVFNFQNPHYFYDDFVTDESYLVHVEPYRKHEYLHSDKHLIESWCEMIGIPCVTKKPELYFLEKEKEASRVFVDKITQKGKKPLVLLQWIGGKVPEDKSPEKLLESLAVMHKRSIPQKVAQVLANKLITDGYTVGVVQADNMPTIEGAEKIFFQIRNVLALLFHAKSFIGIDSFLQHGATAVGLKGVVAWGGTNPNRLGYEMHKNLNKVRECKLCDQPNCHRPNSYIFDAMPNGFMWNCPVDEVCMSAYTADEIKEAFDSIVKAEEKKEEPSGGEST